LGAWFKCRTIDLRKRGSFAFLGFEFRLALGRNRKWRPQFAPKIAFQQHVSQPVGKAIEGINPEFELGR
jgi:hypothetical protein